MTQWQYALVANSDGTVPLNDPFNGMGAEGWELVTIISRPGLPERAYFKRPLQAAAKTPAKKATR